MNAIERLRRDHDILRTKLGLLEGALRMGPEAWFVLRELCYTLGGQLRDHIQREDALVSSCRQAFGPEILHHLAVEHHDEPQLLRTLIELFVQDVPPAWADVMSALTRFIQGLRRHLAEEEEDLFPMLERASVAQQYDSVVVHVAFPSSLHETMTLNRIVRQYPRTKAIFDELLIGLAFEGCDCLDEVAWRHGMESDELIARLEQAIPADHRAAAYACLVPQPREGADAEPCSVGA